MRGRRWAGWVVPLVAATVLAGAPAVAPAGAGAATPAPAVTVLRGLSGPTGIALDRRGDLFVADTGACRVLEVTGVGPTVGRPHPGRPVTVAGTRCGTPFTGLAARPTATGIGFPVAVAVSGSGDLFIANTAGDLYYLPATAGPAFGVTARPGRLYLLGGRDQPGDPSALALDERGDLLVAESSGCRVVAWSPAAAAPVPYAGTGSCGFAGDGGPPAAAELWAPGALAVDAAGDVFIGDTGNDVVREVPAADGSSFGVPVTAGHIATVAGAGTYGYFLGGLSATGPLAELNFIEGLAVTTNGDLLVTDAYSRAVRVVAASAAPVFALPVKADDLYALPGLAAVYPWGVAVDPRGDMVVSDRGAGTVDLLVGAGAGSPA